MIVFLLIISVIALIGAVTLLAILYRRYRNLDDEYNSSKAKCDWLQEKVDGLKGELERCKPCDGQTDYNYHTQYLVPALEEIGCCSPKADSDEGLVLFRYQGWTFYFKGPSNSLLQRLVLPAVLNIAQDDPNLPTFIETCNSVHHEWGPKVVWDVVEDEETSAVSYIFNIVLDVVLPPVSENRDRYITTFLDCFAESADILRLCIRRLSGENISRQERDAFWRVNPKTVITKAHFN